MTEERRFTPSRRALIVGGGAVVATVAIVPAPKSRMPPEWAAFIHQINVVHPDARHAAMSAYGLRSKIKLEEFSGLILHDNAGAAVPALMFGWWGNREGVLLVSPRDVRRVRPGPGGWVQAPVEGERV